jgi:starvation-inducible outer membrane lipoprotein
MLSSHRGAIVIRGSLPTLSLSTLSLSTLSLSALCLLILTGCGTNPAQIVSGLDPTPADAINSLRQKADGQSAVVAGKVGDIAPLLGQVAFEVQDETGVVWVLSDRRPPAMHSQVKIHGIVRTKLGEQYIDQK